MYRVAHYPVELTAEFENWRLIIDRDGSEGWIHHSLLSRACYALVQQDLEKSDLNGKQQVVILRLPENSAHPVLRADAGALVEAFKIGAKLEQ